MGIEREREVLFQAKTCQVPSILTRKGAAKGGGTRIPPKQGLRSPLLYHMLPIVKDKSRRRCEVEIKTAAIRDSNALTIGFGDPGQ